MWMVPSEINNYNWRSIRILVLYAEKNMKKKQYLLNSMLIYGVLNIYTAICYIDISIMKQSIFLFGNC